MSPFLLYFSCKDEEKPQEKEEAHRRNPFSRKNERGYDENSEIKYNPAHGEEGHRCDLPVGAPLDKANAQRHQR